jgi:hypothetical protein
MSTADIDNLSMLELKHYVEKLYEEQKRVEMESSSLNKRI